MSEQFRQFRPAAMVPPSSAIRSSSARADHVPTNINPVSQFHLQSAARVRQSEEACRQLRYALISFTPPIALVNAIPTYVYDAPYSSRIFEPVSRVCSRVTGDFPTSPQDANWTNSLGSFSLREKPSPAVRAASVTQIRIAVRRPAPSSKAPTAASPHRDVRAEVVHVKRSHAITPPRVCRTVTLEFELSDREIPRLRRHFHTKNPVRKSSRTKTTTPTAISQMTKPGNHPDELFRPPPPFESSNFGKLAAHLSVIRSKTRTVSLRSTEIVTSLQHHHPP